MIFLVDFTICGGGAMNHHYERRRIEREWFASANLPCSLSQQW